MKPLLAERLLALVSVLTLLGVCAFGYLAVSSYHRRHVDTLTRAFASSRLPMPRLKEGSSYGFPTFTLTFASEAHLRQAEASGCISAFKQAIQSIHAHIGGEMNPFDAERAVWATHEGARLSMRGKQSPASDAGT